MDSMRSGLQSQVPPDFSVGYGTEIEEDVFDLNGLLALMLAVVALMMAYVVRRRRKARNTP